MLSFSPGRKSVANGSTDVLEHILSCEGCDVDPRNRIEGATPLHLAVRIEHPALKHYIIESLMDAGADATYGCRHSARLGAALNLFLPRTGSGIRMEKRFSILFLSTTRKLAL
jgi:hypothetical protein